jgi:glycerol-1-phosphatase
MPTGETRRAGASVAAGGESRGPSAGSPTGGPAGALVASPDPLVARYDVALLDLDGVIYLGQAAVPGAADSLAAARSAGMRLAFVTNNASRTPEAVAAHLRELGVAARAEEVVTSAQTAAHVLADRLPFGARVLVVGGEGLRREATVRGFTLVESADDDPAAVLQGFSPDIGWRQLAEAAVAVRRGAFWLATNLDSTVPSERGSLPGNGSLVGTVRVATGVDPMSTGKPDPAMHRESVQRTGARNPLVVGDRLDTDIEGATRVGCDSLLVLTGVTTPATLLAAPPEHRPRYLSADLAGLLRPHPAPQTDGQTWTCGRWSVRTEASGLRLAASGAGEPGRDDDLDALRALCAAAWSAAPGERGGAGRQPVAVAPVDPPAAALAERMALPLTAARASRTVAVTARISDNARR